MNMPLRCEINLEVKVRVQIFLFFLFLVWALRQQVLRLPSPIASGFVRKGKGNRKHKFSPPKGRGYRCKWRLLELWPERTLQGRMSLHLASAAFAKHLATRLLSARICLKVQKEEGASEHITKVKKKWTEIALNNKADASESCSVAHKGWKDRGIHGYAAPIGCAGW